MHRWELQLFVGPNRVFWKEDVNAWLAEPKKSCRRQVEMISISGEARIHPITKKRANRKILNYKWQTKTNINKHKSEKLTYSNDPTDWEARTLRVVAVGRQNRGTATLTAILTSASQSAANASPSNANPTRLEKNEEQARVRTAGLFPLWELLTF